ncbi:hypothetical protein KIH41_10900 [Litoribacter ruber]|uniref:Uncharacterized protein n=1 Tax=Litoribacter ruber TaxID=702568 RepID=A0AAP2CNP2_9BACT|nr:MULTISPECIES: hypothetical protein [Litoribacter]MBS9525087.1 hypothetical protein [Litoribacter alkaliphilus]MBT0811784.1 hypothetical protein [Litoribacter ruber]
MRKLTLLLLALCFNTALVFGQEKKYMVFEFMKVETGNTINYMDHKDFLERIYKKAVEKGDISGWDFWSLKSGTDSGEFQYVTVTYYEDPVKMMNGIPLNKLVEYGKEVYDTLNEQQLTKMLKDAETSRDLAVRSYMEEIARTDTEFEMKPGVLASFDLMKAVEGRFEEYEAAEKEVFQPFHQKRIDNDLMGGWRLLRTALPFGSEAKSTHMTMNFYRDYLQFFNSMEYEDLEASEEDKQAVERGLQSRDQKWVYLATLEKVVR